MARYFHTFHAISNKLLCVELVKYRPKLTENLSYFLWAYKLLSDNDKLLTSTYSLHFNMIWLLFVCSHYSQQNLQVVVLGLMRYFLDFTGYRLIQNLQDTYGLFFCHIWSFNENFQSFLKLHVTFLDLKLYFSCGMFSFPLTCMTLCKFPHFLL